MLKTNARVWLSAASLVFMPLTMRAAANIVIVNGDPAGVGFNDPTPVAPVGGNSGTTLGAQRLIAFQAAADKWGSTLSSAVTIRVNAVWTALTCNASSAVLGSAGPTEAWRDFSNVPVANHWYGKALADAIAGTDLDSSTPDITANFNVNLGNSGCLNGIHFYLGLDNNHGGNVDLVTILTHEFGHGLGFLTFTNGQNGAQFNGAPSIWDDFLLDNTTNKTWTMMSNAERAASALNNGHLVWNGGNVTAAIPQVLQPQGSSFVGADSAGRGLMYAPTSFQQGSSISHWDRSMTPDQLMEPVYNTDLTHEVTPPHDLTFPLLKDIGWNGNTTPPQLPTLLISKTHTGSFSQGQNGAAYTIVVSNSGPGSTNGSVTVTDTIPAGLTATAIGGTGWSCTAPAGPCRRSDVLGSGGSYPPITLTVNVSATAPTSVTNVATVSGGGASNSSAASDFTSIAASSPPGGNGSNLALGKPATQSSTYPFARSAAASSAVDGKTDGNFYDGSVTATNPDTNAWWQVDLGASASVNSVVIWNRTDCCGSRLSDYWVFVSNTPFQTNDTPATLQSRAGTFASHQTSAPSPAATIVANTQGRYVRIQLSGTNYLSLAEVQVFGTGGSGVSNLTLGKAAAQSSTYPIASAAASSAIDGNTDGNFYDGSVTATNLDANAWWQVDLATSASISSVVIWNRTDCCSTRLGDYWIFISDTPFLPGDTPSSLQSRPGTFASHQTGAPSPSVAIPVNTQGRYVRVQLSGTDYLSLAEVQVLGQ